MHRYRYIDMYICDRSRSAPVLKVGYDGLVSVKLLCHLCLYRNQAGWV